MGGREHVGDDPALVVAEGLVGGDDVAQLVVADRVVDGVRVTAEDADQRVG